MQESGLADLLGTLLIQIIFICLEIILRGSLGIWKYINFSFFKSKGVPETHQVTQAMDGKIFILI